MGETSSSVARSLVGRSMRIRRRLALCFLACAGLAMANAPSVAAETAAEKKEAEGWVPALRLGVGVHVQGLNGSASSPDSLDPIRNPPTLPGEPDRSSANAPGDSAVTEFIRVGMRLYAPENLLGEGAPRLFAQAGVETPLDDGFIAGRYNFDVDILDFGTTTGDVSDFCPEVPPTTLCSYEARIFVDILANWHFGIGSDFRLPIADGQYHIVPTLEYFGQAFESEGTFGVTLSQGLGTEDDPRVISEKSQTEFIHGVAAGLGLEVDVWEADWLAARLFLNARAAWLLTERKASFSGMNPTPTVNFNQANFSAQPSGIVLTIASGIEFRWKGRKTR
ncbi:MAG: hypothetical protein CL933_18895 [Deltaproteobacteria bacterium]|nr:hypothetical protein [Deltaproteobacteria bacterium]